MKSLLAVAFSAVVLSGCTESKNRPGAKAIIDALQEGTYKQWCLCLNGTFHDRLVGQNAYLVKDYVSRTTQSRTVREGESIGDVIAEVQGQAQNRSAVFFLVRGIGKKTEKIFYGQATQPSASELRPIAGDLLVIDPPPTHALFKEYEDAR